MFSLGMILTETPTPFLITRFENELLAKRLYINVGFILKGFFL